MLFVYFSGIDTEGNYRECNLGGPDAETCFDVLSRLVKAGWQLHGIVLKENKSSIRLPIDAFEGEPMAEPINNLKHTWQEILI